MFLSLPTTSFSFGANVRGQPLYHTGSKRRNICEGQRIRRVAERYSTTLFYDEHCDQVLRPSLERISCSKPSPPSRIARWRIVGLKLHGKAIY